MAYTYYNISCTNGGNYLNLYGSGAVTDHRNVTMYSTLSSNDQKWGVTSLTGKQQVFSGSNTAFALNAKRVGTNWNCDVLKASGNLTDSQVKFESAGNGTYYICLANYTNRYLTAASNSSGADVYWTAKSTTANQKWKLTKTSAPSGGSVTPPSGGGNQDIVKIKTGAHILKTPNSPTGRFCCWNQFYTGVVAGLNGKSNGCTVVTALNLVNFYGPKAYDISDVASTFHGGSMHWTESLPGNLRVKGRDDLAKEAAFPAIRREIDNGHPVIINIGTDPKNHTMMCIGYTGSGNQNSDFIVMDSGRKKVPESRAGFCHTLAKAMTGNIHPEGIWSIRYTEGTVAP